MHVSVPTSQAELSRETVRDKSRAIRGGALDDAQLTARVKEALIAAGSITAKQIMIETANGIVCLSGPVDSETMKQATLATARSVCGDRNVQDQLILRDEATRRR